MKIEALKSKDGIERLRLLKHRGTGILECSFDTCTREEGRELLVQLVARLQKEAAASVILLIGTQGAVHDAAQGNEWKRHLELFDSRLKKSAIYGLAPMHRIALAGLRMYARLIGREKAALQARVFDSRDAALEYLVSGK